METRRVLAGLVFTRSPVQSRLLRFLLERTLGGGTPPTQYEIAVDGLGKDEDFDLASDSYPRVQISRLRSNLDSYYSRNAPGNGLRVTIESGVYRLGLEKIAPPAPIATITTAEPTAAETPAQTAAQTDMVQPVAPALAAVDPPDRGEARRRNVVRALLAAIAVLLIALVVTNIPSTTPAPATAPLAKPAIRLVVQTDALVEDDQNTLDRVQVAARRAEIQLAYSWVSEPFTLDAADERAADADYTLTLDFARPATGALSVFVELVDQEGRIRFSDQIFDNQSKPELFAEELTAALVFITSPTGLIASDRLARVEGDPRNGYECFVRIENNRADGHRTAALVDRCIKSFPDSEYQPFFLARRAFSYFQKRIIEGKPIQRGGEGWMDLQSALDADPFNAFANFTAAKVELANGNCVGAQGFVENALEKAASYPALIVAIEAEAASCPVSWSQINQGLVTLETIVRTNPSPDPLLHLYLLISLMSAGERDQVEALVRRLPVSTPRGIEQETIARIQRAIDDPTFATGNAERIRDDLRLFVWGPESVEKVMDYLTVDNEEIATPS